ncbi:MAG: tRNA (adenosine(37)-N6)-dimethylallyltransferase MiaA [Bacteroidota bacterium]|nr:tRNA (adenosine(37)-N6)-dimethylallyltransferase MiaA [Bacteroidota bacterium]
MKTSLPHILVIVGPTASGKTSLALEVAKHIPSEIISADSRQVYKHLSIGTAKPSPSELQSVPHHFIDIREPNEKYNAGDFQDDGRRMVSEILLRKKMPIVAGGTGLYVQALVDGFFEQPEFSGVIRKELETRLEKTGKEALYKELQTVDPLSASTMDATKFRRVIRALEVFFETGVPISKFHADHQPEQIYDAMFVGLQWEREELYTRINQRVEKMFAEGFLSEVEHLQKMGYDDRYQALQTVGYKEAFAYLRKEISYERMVELMKQNTRRFAKRQLTWFRKEKRIRWFKIHNDHEIQNIAQEIVSNL